MTNPAELPQRRPFSEPDTPVAQVKLLSNGHYHVMLSAAGGGYSRCGSLALTRWRDAAVCDSQGSFCYVRERHSGALWSATHQPTLRRADHYVADFSDGIARFTRCDDGIETRTAIAVAGADDVEVRRVCVRNHSARRRSIELTSYAEVVPAPAATDAAHPAFNKLFVETEIDLQRQAILCTHRPGTPGAATPTMFHLLSAAQALDAPPAYETDRLALIGRGRSGADPQGPSVGLTGRAGPVLDPVVAIGCAITLEPGQSAWVDWITGIAPWQGRECLAGILPVQSAQGIRRACVAARRPSVRRTLQRAGRGAGAGDRAQCLGRPLVSARVVRRRQRARFGAQLGMPHRFDRAKLVGAVGSGRSATRAPGHGRARAHLVRPDAALVQLLAPPFDRAEPNPGYIKGYLPGVRENGGQYTHAAVWAGMAYAAMGDARRAWQFYEMLAPINHAASAAAIARYKTEPYVMASDVCACAQHLGCGGWTWYTGSAGWMYRYSVESLLGLRVRGDQLHLAPCVPADWDEYELRYRFRQTVYAICVRRTSGAPELMLDGQRQPGLALSLADDGQPHRVELRIGMDAHRSTDDERISHGKK